MIITRPTGLFRLLLPKVESDSTSVIFTISNEDPPRSDLNFQIIPIGIESKKIIPIYTRDERIDLSGELIFTVKRNNTQVLTSGRKSFAIGQTLDFVDTVTEEIAPKFVGDDLETRHNSNFPAYESLGITQEEDGEIFSSAVAAQRVVLDDIKQLQDRHKELRGIISDLSKEENEINRLIEGLEVVLGQDPDSELSTTVDKLNDRKIVNSLRRKEAIEEINTIPDQILVKRNEFNALSEIIK